MGNEVLRKVCEIFSFFKLTWKKKKLWEKMPQRIKKIKHLPIQTERDKVQREVKIIGRNPNAYKFKYN